MHVATTTCAESNGTTKDYTGVAFNTAANKQEHRVGAEETRCLMTWQDNSNGTANLPLQKQPLVTPNASATTVRQFACV